MSPRTPDPFQPAIRRFFAAAAGCAALVAVISSCDDRPPLPANMAQRVERWFVSPTSRQLDTLSRFNISKPRWDSLVAVIRTESSARTGAQVVEIHDSSGVKYVMGYRTPMQYSRDSLYPLIIHLHGGIGIAENTKGSRAYEMFLPLADSFPLFLASPSASRAVPWWSPLGLSRVLQTVRFMALHYPVDPDRVILAGVSDGAVGCYAAASAIAGPFAGFIAIAGSGVVLQSAGFPLLPQNMMQRPIYQVYAGKDHVFAAEATERYVRWLAGNGVTVETSFHASEEHDFDYRDTELAAFTRLARAWRRPADTRGLSWVFVPAFPQAPAHLIEWWAAGAEKAFPFVNGYWRGDTLAVHLAGLTRVTAAFCGSRIPAAPWVRSETLRPRRMQAQRDSGRKRLLYMQHTCIPSFPADLVFFTIGAE